MDEDEVELMPYVATCATTGCENEGIQLTVLATPPSPTIMCGPCGHLIADVQTE